MSEEEINRLGDAIAELSARIQAATYELSVDVLRDHPAAVARRGGVPAESSMQLRCAL